jgi:hypothetical protein
MAPVANTQSKEVNLTKRVQTSKGMLYCPSAHLRPPDETLAEDYATTEVTACGFLPIAAELG